MKSKAEKIVKSYKIKCALVGVAYAIALIVCILLINTSTLLGISGIVALGLSIRIPFEKLLEKDIESVIHEDLDPETFEEIIKLGIGKKNNRLQSLGAMSSGNHARVMELVKENEKKATNPVEICNNLYRKGFVYFEQGDLENLRLIVREYAKLKKNNPKYVSLLENFSVFEKYDAFLDEDYEYVVDVCDIDLKDEDSKKLNHKLTKINVGFYRAVSLYKLGRIDEARKGFESIIDYAPKMYKAKLSKEYLDIMK